MGDVSEESLLDYIFTAGGKVKNADIMKTYKQFINHNDKQLRAKYREEFKVIIDRIAVVKSENGEKHLVLKKRYKQLMQDRGRDVERAPAIGDQRQSAVGPAPKGPSLVSWCGPAITVTEAPEPQPTEEERWLEETPLLLVPNEAPGPSLEESLGPTLQEEESERDMGSKSESEQDPEEESPGGAGLPSVALDPLEKEWIHSAACGHLSNLSQLLQQEPSLSAKKDFILTALHWAAKHGRVDMVTLMASFGADVNTKAGYTPLHIAALHGHHHIIDLLVRKYGAKESLRDYSGRLACQYLVQRDPPGPPAGTDSESEFHTSQSGERRHRKLATFFNPKRWGSAEDLPRGSEERGASHQLVLPAFRPRKFSR